MDLGPGWEKKALIIIGVIFLGIVIYAYNPFTGTSNADVQNQSITDTPVETPAPPVTSNNSTDNSTNMTGNITFQISADVAKNIALGANPGFTAGTPNPGNVTINNTVVHVWIVPLKQGSISKMVYVNLFNGIIVGNA